MLNAILFEGLNDILDGNVFSVNCELSSVSNRKTLYIITRQKLSEEEFIKKTKNVIFEENISCIDDFSISIDLTEDILNNIFSCIKISCFHEYAKMKK
jgi:hypothetical protein